MSIPILFLTYYFPPIGGPGVQRSLKFVRYLPDEGFEPIVVAGPAHGRDRWEPEDPSLLAELPADLALYRSSGSPPGREAASTRLTRILGRSTRRFRWWRDNALESGLRAGKDHGVRLVFVTASPFEGIESAVRIGRELQVPVIADLRDPWALDETIVYPTSLHRSRESRAMLSALSEVDLIVMNTPEAEKAVRDTFPGLAGRCRHVTNGYDPADFEGVRPAAHGDQFVITHTGYLYTDIGLSHRRRSWLQRALGGELVPVDLLARSPFFLLRALELLCREEPTLFDRIQLNLIGPATDADRDCVARSSVGRLVHLRGHVPHREALEAMAGSDLLFFPMHGLPREMRSRIVPAKVYEYLGSGRPILAAVPEGDARDFILEAHAGRVVEPGDVEGIARGIRSFLEEAPLTNRPISQHVQRFARPALTTSLADHFRKTLLEGSNTHVRSTGQRKEERSRR